MKKYFALILSVVIAATCFTACKAELKNGAVVSDAAGKNFAAVTKEDGGVIRDQAGNLVVLVTDADGGNVKGENGEYQTNIVALKNALVIGNRIECPEYSLTIPKGWKDSLSYTNLVIQKDGTEDKITIMTNDESSLNDVIDTNLSNTINQVTSVHKNAATENRSITIGENIEAQFHSVFVSDTGYRTEDGEIMASYLGYIFFAHGSTVYTCMIASNRDMAPYIDEVAEILGTIEFIY